MQNNKIYFVQEIETGVIRIGFGDFHVNKNNLRILAEVVAGISDEIKIHSIFEKLRINGEWYKPEVNLIEFIERIKKDPLDLKKIIEEFKSKDGTKECHNWIKIANNLPCHDVETEELISIDSASKLLGISPQTLRNWEDQGKISPQYTNKGHRRYFRSQIIEIRKKQIQQQELLLPGVTPSYLIRMVEEFVQGFDPLEKVNLTVSQDAVLGKVRITVDSADGLTTVSKSFNIKN